MRAVELLLVAALVAVRSVPTHLIHPHAASSLLQSKKEASSTQAVKLEARHIKCMKMVAAGGGGAIWAARVDEQFVEDNSESSSAVDMAAVTNVTYDLPECCSESPYHVAIKTFFDWGIDANDVSGTVLDTLWSLVLGDVDGARIRTLGTQGGSFPFVLGAPWLNRVLHEGKYTNSQGRCVNLAPTTEAAVKIIDDWTQYCDDKSAKVCCPGKDTCGEQSCGMFVAEEKDPPKVNHMEYGSTLATEFFASGDLFYITVRAKWNSTFPDLESDWSKIAWKIAEDTTKASSELYANKLHHHDIKPLNYMIRADATPSPARFAAEASGGLTPTRVVTIDFGEMCSYGVIKKPLWWLAEVHKPAWKSYWKNNYIALKKDVGVVSWSERYLFFDAGMLHVCDPKELGAEEKAQGQKIGFNALRTCSDKYAEKKGVSQQGDNPLLMIAEEPNCNALSLTCKTDSCFRLSSSDGDSVRTYCAASSDDKRDALRTLFAHGVRGRVYQNDPDFEDLLKIQKLVYCNDETFAAKPSTPPFAPPESMMKHYKKEDVWGYDVYLLGSSLLFMLGGGHPTKLRRWDSSTASIDVQYYEENGQAKIPFTKAIIETILETSIKEGVSEAVPLWKGLDDTTKAKMLELIAMCMGSWDTVENPEALYKYVTENRP